MSAGLGPSCRCKDPLGPLASPVDGCLPLHLFTSPSFSGCLCEHDFPSYENMVILDQGPLQRSHVNMTSSLKTFFPNQVTF